MLPYCPSTLPWSSGGASNTGKLYSGIAPHSGTALASFVARLAGAFLLITPPPLLLPGRLAAPPTPELHTWGCYPFRSPHCLQRPPWCLIIFRLLPALTLLHLALCCPWPILPRVCLPKSSLLLWGFCSPFGRLVHSCGFVPPGRPDTPSNQTPPSNSSTPVVLAPPSNQTPHSRPAYPRQSDSSSFPRSVRISPVPGVTPMVFSPLCGGVNVRIGGLPGISAAGRGALLVIYSPAAPLSHWWICTHPPGLPKPPTVSPSSHPWSSPPYVAVLMSASEAYLASLPLDVAPLLSSPLSCSPYLPGGYALVPPPPPAPLVVFLPPLDSRGIAVPPSALSAGDSIHGLSFPPPMHLQVPVPVSLVLVCVYTVSHHNALAVLVI